MARKLILEVTCDICQDIDDIEVEATELPPIGVGNAKQRVLGVCKEHRGPIEDFLDLLKRLGVTVDSLDSGAKVPVVTGIQGEQAFCPIPDCDRHNKPLKNKNTLQTHFRQQHGMTLADYEAKVTAGEPVDQVGQASLLDESDFSEFKCDLPDVENPKQECGWLPPAGSSRPGQSKAMHRWRVHGIKKGDEKS